MTSAQLTVISSMATRQILPELAEAYTRTSGRRVTVGSIGGIEAARRIRDGAACDLVVLAADALARLAGEDFVAADSVRAFALSPTGIAVPAGAARPSRCDAAAIQTMVGTARVIGLSTGPSGGNVRALLQAWGMGEDELARRTIVAPTGVPVARLLAEGKADVGFQQLSELMGEPGIDIVGAVPAALLPMTTFSAGVCRSAADPDGARALITYLVSPEAGPAKRRYGMEPSPQQT